ncbi:MAG: precorrin-2 C(20)-methyltransferase [Elainellaceae cyanobacterium]
MSESSLSLSQSESFPAPSIGTLFGVGVGPGDPDLITVKGVETIRQVSAIAFPAGLNGKPGIAERIAERWLQPHQERIPLGFPYVLDPGELNEAWDAAAERVWSYLAQGQDVTFLCEGDISFYSTFTYLAHTLLRDHPDLAVEAVPGVCSPMAAATALGLPLTTQGQKLMVLPALYTVADLETTLDVADVVVLMKVKSVYESVWQVLKQRDLLKQSAVVDWATWPQQKIYKSLSDRPSLDLSYFSLLIVQKQPFSL